MRNHWLQDFPLLETDEAYYVDCAIYDARHLLNLDRDFPWRGYLQLLDERLDYFLGRIDE